MSACCRWCRGAALVQLVVGCASRQAMDEARQDNPIAELLSGRPEWFGAVLDQVEHYEV